MSEPLYTVGHGTADARQLAGLLLGAGIASVVDVRTAPGSKRNPEMARSEMARWLPSEGIEYAWEKRLGGWRKATPDGPDTGLRHGSFTGYAEHMRTSEFASVIDSLLVSASGRPTTVLCAESVWWRCHRRMIADYVELVHGHPVRHLMHDGSLQTHVPTDAARLCGDLLIYDGGQGRL
jgi:uncharacterized protein (DUF488 family)